MTVIVVANRKGGVGKTTLSYNLGFTYAMKKKKVLFVDLDSQSNLSLICNVEPVTIEEFKEATIYEMNPYIDIVPATKRFSALENEINDLIDRNSYLRDSFLPQIKGKYDYMIIDTPPALNILNINAFCIADFVYIVMNPDFFSVAGLKEMREILEQIKGINKKLEWKIILNAYFKNRKLTNDMEEVLQKQSEYTGIEIPHRQHVQNTVIQKRPALENEDIKTAFFQLADIN